jgi:hypothetical protein
MSELEVIFYSVLTVGAFIGILIGWMLFSPDIRIKIMRKLLKKNYGLIYIRSYGKALYPMVKDFSNAIIKTKTGIWIVEENKVYRLVKSDLGGKTIKSKKFKWNVLPEDISYRGGIPCLFLDIEDMKPLKFENDPWDEQTRNPTQVEATLSKEIVAIEARAQRNSNKMIQKLKTLMILLLLFVIIAIAIGYLSYNQNSNIPAWFGYLNQTITTACAGA